VLVSQSMFDGHQSRSNADCLISNSMQQVNTRAVIVKILEEVIPLYLRDPLKRGTVLDLV
jgi:hypothetical protein